LSKKSEAMETLTTKPNSISQKQWEKLLDTSETISTIFSLDLESNKSWYVDYDTKTGLYYVSMHEFIKDVFASREEAIQYIFSNIDTECLFLEQKKK
jgi:hypothetical protein